MDTFTEMNNRLNILCQHTSIKDYFLEVYDGSSITVQKASELGISLSKLCSLFFSYKGECFGAVLSACSDKNQLFTLNTYHKDDDFTLSISGMSNCTIKSFFDVCSLANRLINERNKKEHIQYGVSDDSFSQKQLFKSNDTYYENIYEAYSGYIDRILSAIDWLDTEEQSIEADNTFIYQYIVDKKGFEIDKQTLDQWCRKSRYIEHKKKVLKYMD